MVCDLIILSKHEDGDLRAAAVEQRILERLEAEGIDCLTMPPLYHLAESSKLWGELADRASGALMLCWLHPRPAHWLLQRHRIAIDESHIVDLRTFADAEAASAAVVRLAEGHVGRRSSSHAAGKRARKGDGKGRVEVLRAPTRQRWYPVVDGSRCVQCHHCLQFCLFGVYDLDAEGKLRVRNPDECKPGCPACSRICPESAIMFPLHEKDAAIAGAPGQWVTLDAAAKKMYYMRTQLPCPVCGRKANAKSHGSALGDDLCPECGRPMVGQAGTKPAAKQPFDDLDLLVDQLDQAMRRKS